MGGYSLTIHSKPTEDINGIIIISKISIIGKDIFLFPPLSLLTLKIL